jgi:2-polyprenyl-3-methyl-5-hydroxy-6-metoxy-1,4-benzoquinol methylase
LSCQDCDLLWISPQPDASALVRLYESYYGSLQLSPEPDQRASGVKAWIRAAILASSYGYPEPVTNRGLVRPLGAVLSRAPWIAHRARFGLGWMLPPYRRAGRLLDIGCGYGWYQRLMQDLGWETVGVEADSAVAAAGRERYRVQICDGSLEEQRFESASFDAIVTRHSIEHVPDPRGMLVECRRLLAPKGWLGIATPNGASLCSRLFGRNWRGLTPPWHLHLFSPKALRRLLVQTGFAACDVRTTAVSAHWVWCASQAIRRGAYSGGTPVGSSRTFQLAEALMNTWRGDLGEELEALASN